MVSSSASISNDMSPKDESASGLEFDWASANEELSSEMVSGRWFGTSLLLLVSLQRDLLLSVFAS